MGQRCIPQPNAAAALHEKRTPLPPEVCACQPESLYALQVFTTCGSDRKKKYLLDTFPQLREDHIGNSRSTSFEELVMHKVASLSY